MLNASAEARFVVDEDSFRALDSEALDLEQQISALVEVLCASREAGDRTAICTGYERTACLAQELHEVLTGGLLPHDLGALAFDLLDKCARFDDDPDYFVESTLSVDGEDVESFGVGFAFDRVLSGHAVGVIAVAGRYEPGLHTVECAASEAVLAFVINTGHLPNFWRTVYSIESVSESDFFVVAELAFPELRFAENLSFSRFEGRYPDLRDLVVAHLSAINDRFQEAFGDAHGLADEVSARVGVSMSPEAPNTRGSERLMRTRDVVYLGATYRCEWHSKLEPHRNRIHLHPGNDGTGGRVLVGIFADHLPT